MHLINSGRIFTGTSGIVLPVPNKLFYPTEFQDKSRLSYYASLFNSIEVNSSFYKIPMSPTIQKWSESVPANFRFTFKLWRGITHNPGLAFDPSNVFLFMDRIATIGTKKGCLLVQFPPSITISSLGQLEKLLVCINKANQDQQWKIALEFRNTSWYIEDIYELIEKQHSIIVFHDLPASATPFGVEKSTTVYLRFHGPNGGYRGSYPDDFLYEYAHYIKEWKEDGKTVYAYFNNTMGNAVNNLIKLNSYLFEPP